MEEQADAPPDGTDGRAHPSAMLTARSGAHPATPRTPPDHQAPAAFTPAAAALAVLQRIGTGVCVVDAALGLHYANRAAQHMLACAHTFVAGDARVSLRHPGSHVHLAERVRLAATAAGGGTALAVPRQGRLPLTLLVMRWPDGPDGPDAAVLLFLRDPEASDPQAVDRLRGMFGLTPAEALVSQAIAHGKAVEDVATALGIGVGTVRSHLKKALLKTGTRRQPALAALIARSVAALM